MNSIIRLILSAFVLIAGIILSGVWPYLPNWIGFEFSVVSFVFSVYVIYRIWTRKTIANVNKVEINEK